MDHQDHKGSFNSFKTERSAFIASGGPNNDIPLTDTFIDITGTAPFSITGMSTAFLSNLNGMHIILHNRSGGVMTLAHEDAGSASYNQLSLPNAFPVTIPNDGTAVLIYNPTASKWELVACTPEEVWKVGMILTSVLEDSPGVGTNPLLFLGYGTWIAFGTGRVLVGLDIADPDFDTIMETGGAKTHTSGVPSATVSVDNVGGGVTVAVGDGTHTHDTINVMPYETVYYWLRTV
jgi:hypothetical protein